MDSTGDGKSDGSTTGAVPEVAEQVKTILRSLSAEDIFAAEDFVIEEVECPEWKGIVHIQTISAAERDAFELAIYDENEARKKRDRGGRVRAAKSMRARLVARCACNEKGVRVFTDDDVARLSAKSALVVDRLYAVAARLNGLTKEDEDTLLKDFDNDQDEPSRTP